MITNLVVNGCSYMDTYAQGGGHIDLAKQLKLTPESLTITGSANTRILRSTLKHSYETSKKCLYILGMTFISREELPICRYDKGVYPTERDVREGAWTNPQNQLYGKSRWIAEWNDTMTKQWIVFRELYERTTLVDRLENLMYQMLAVIDSLTLRGHSCIMYQQADEWWQVLDHNQKKRLRFLQGNKHIVNDFEWCAVREQHRHGVPYVQHERDINRELRHRQPGEHKWINRWIEKYIKQHGLLL